MSAERSMHDCLVEQVEIILNALPPRVSFDDWYESACDFEIFVIGDDVHREAVSYAYGYLQGAADAADVTMSTLLDEHDVSTDKPARAKPRRARKA